MAQTIKLKRSSTGGAVPSTSSLSLGEVAINTYDGKMYIKKNDGTDAIVQVGGDSSSAVWKSYDYTATSNQTSFSGNDNNSESLSYVAGFVQVFLNGILLDPAVDYAASTGTSIVLTSGASTGDLLQIESFTQIIGTGDILVDTFPVSSTQTAFTLSQDPVNKSNISVYVEGVYQESSTYSLSTTTLTLSESPANGTTVEVVIGTRNVTLDNIADLTISGTLHAGALDLGDANIINVNEISLDTIKGDADANTNITFSGSDVTTFTQGGQERLRLNTTGAQVTGNIVVSGTVDGRDVAADGVTADAALSRAGGAMGGAITTNSTFDGRDVSVDGTKLDGIESGATADQTDVEIRAAVESASDSNVFTNADHSKLDAIEALADVTDATNVTSAGALMDSEVTNLAQVKAFDSSDYATAAQGTTANAALPKAGGTLTGNLSLGDNVKAQFGAGNDLQIYHDGSTSIITDQGTGFLALRGDGNVTLQNASGTENKLVASSDGAVTLYYDNSPKIATTSTGIDVTGRTTTDNATVGSGTASTYVDLTVNGASTSNYGPMIELQSAGTAFGKISNVGRIQGGTSTDMFVTTASTNSLVLGTNNAANFTIANGGAATFTGAITANAGVTVDTINIDGGTIATTSGNFFIDSAADIYLDADGANVFLRDDGTNFGNFNHNGNNLKISSTIQDGDIVFAGNDGGSTITALTLDMSNAGRAVFNAGASFADHVYLADNAKLVLGNADDLQIFCDGTDGYIRNHVSGGSIYNRAHTNWVVQTNASDGGADDAIKALRNGAIELYHNNVLKLETNSGGVTVTGTAILGGATFVDNATAYFGTGNDLRMYHDGSNSYIKNLTGWLNIPMSQNGATFANADFSEIVAKFMINGSCELYENGSKKLETTTTGINVTGAVTGTSFSDGYVTWTAAQFNRSGAAIEFQFTPTNANWKVKIGANGDNPTEFNAYTGDADFSGEVSTPSAKLKAIAESNTDTAVDVFVYDTRKDSDGGAWRKRTQNTSWYNEALNTSTRGARKEFPSVAVIVAETQERYNLRW